MDVIFDNIVISGSEQEGAEFIVFQRPQVAQGAAVPPTSDDLRKFVGEVERVNLLILDGLAAGDPSRGKMLEMLLAAARVGAMGDSYDTKLGASQLELAEKVLLRRVADSRQPFINKVYWLSVCWAVACLAGVGLLTLYPASDAGAYKILGALGNPLTAFSYSLIGIALGVSITATMRLRQVRVELIGNFDPYDFAPLSRFSYVTLLAISIFVLLHFNVVQLGIGPELLNNFRTRPALGLLVGLLAGASEPLLASIFEERAKPDASKTTE